ncbi:hypothetical protein BDF14DRAFT_1796637 [Spinellus fusiger]|nr:hypothetical protein BDF14DRAFT_1796637 [Spinellus fusiger]
MIESDTIGSESNDESHTAGPPPYDTATRPHKRPLLPKFSTIHTDKYPQHLRHDFPLPNFDRNLTVEKAHFEPQSLVHPVTSSHPSLPVTAPHPTLPVASLPPLSLQTSTDSLHDPPSSSPVHSTFDIPLSSPPRPLHSQPSHPPSSTHVISYSKGRGFKADSERISPNKRKRPPLLSGSATPSQVFHRNLVDAVSNVEDSDENERYIYPYSNSTAAADTGHYWHDHRSQTRWQTHTGFLQQLFKHPSVEWSLEEETPTTRRNSQPYHHRPKLRNYVVDHPHHRPKADSLPHQFRGDDSRYSSRRSYATYCNDGYTSDDEGDPLLQSERVTVRKQKTCSRRIGDILVVMCVISCVCFLVSLYHAQPLENIQVSMGRVLASDKELMFDLHVKAKNWNWWTVHVAEADISVFAFSRLVPHFINTTSTQQEALTPEEVSEQGVDPAEYLGSCYRFDEPLCFSSDQFKSVSTEAISQVRIKSPGADKSGNERWSRMIRYRYGLVARGVLKYRLLPLSWAYSQSMAICDVTSVDPTTGKVFQDPDQGYCLGYGQPYA